MRAARVRQLMCNRTDQRRLAIAPSGPPDPGALPRAGAAPITADNELATELLPVAQRDTGALRIGALRHHMPLDLGDAIMGIERG